MEWDELSEHTKRRRIETAARHLIDADKHTAKAAKLMEGAGEDEWECMQTRFQQLLEQAAVSP